MEEIRRIARSAFDGRERSGGQAVPASPPRRIAPEALTEGARQRDVVELTEPHRAALQLLRERVLDGTRAALSLPKSAVHRSPFARVPAKNPRVFLDRLLSDQNLMAGIRRADWPPEKVDAAIERGLVDGMAETAEVLHEIGQLSPDAWSVLALTLQEFYRKLTDTTPDEVRARLFR